MAEIDIKELREFIHYDSRTGEMVWQKRPSKKALLGKPVGGFDHYGYRSIGFKGKRLKQHRVAWAIHYGEWPALHIDHIDGNPANNAISNLRLADQSQNIANSAFRKTNTSGYKGVHFHKAAGKWRARICVHYKYVCLGLHETKEAAHEAYAAAARRFQGEFACPDGRVGQ